MSNDGNFDLSGVFHVQQNYLTDLSNSYPNVNNAPLIAKYVLNLQNKVDDVTQSYKKADTTADNILTEQNDMINIVKTEQDRVEKKKEFIDQAVMEQKRKALFTESNKLRNAEYTKIILIFILCVVIHILLIAAYKYFFEEPIPDKVFTMFALAHLCNFAIWTIIAFSMYVNIQTRSQINFNKLDLPPPSQTSYQDSTPAVADYNNLFKDLGYCYAENCCGSNTTWIKETGQCVDANYSKAPSVDNELNPTPSTNTEGFETLNTLPEFLKGAQTITYDTDEYVFDPLTATDDDIKKKTRADITDLFNSSINVKLPPTIDQNELNDNIAKTMPDSEILGEEPSFGVKCGFTTMTNSCDIGYSPAINPIHNPEFTNPLLPQTTSQCN